MNPPLSRVLLALILASALLAGRVDGAESAKDPGQAVRAANDQVLAIIYDQPADRRPLAARMRPVLKKYFDFEMLTRRAIGPGWRQLTPGQQQRATGLLTELIVRNYCAHFDTSVRSRITIAAPVALAAGRCEVPTTIIYSGRNISVTYRAEQMPDGWRFYDVIVEGVSLVANYRAQFTALFQQGGAEAIIHALEEKLGEPLSA